MAGVLTAVVPHFVASLPLGIEWKDSRGDLVADLMAGRPDIVRSGDVRG